ncbi:hypothetical protein [Aestuariivivens insulae]|uniref:hypothetical protein n=1 Tax=Aestuariivivens insulae TaxID=1621988 RepID=UPI001F5795A8|nr:hypothetical protein [Aestuariivivens insulae]
MKTLNNTQHKNRLKAFILTYCSSANNRHSNQEIKFIKSKTKIDNLAQIYCEINKHNDYQIIQKIVSCIDKYGYTKHEIENLLNDIKEMIEINSGYSLLQLNTYRGLKHILR